MKNITLSAEDYLIDEARHRASGEKTTLNAVFREWLRRYARPAATGNEYRKLVKQLRHVKAGRTFSRDEMNER